VQKTVLAGRSLQKVQGSSLTALHLALFSVPPAVGVLCGSSSFLFSIEEEKVGKKRKASAFYFSSPAGHMRTPPNATLPGVSFWQAASSARSGFAPSRLPEKGQVSQSRAEKLTPFGCLPILRMRC
jgi:hypothetical protein